MKTNRTEALNVLYFKKEMKVENEDIHSKNEKLSIRNLPE
jgi:hypothetical protein